MRVLMLSWEFPPRNVGGLARHVDYLARALSRDGAEVFVITSGQGGASTPEVVYGTRVYRVSPYAVSAPDFLVWSLQLNLAMLERAVWLVNSLGSVDVVHAHDWLVTFVGRALKHLYQVPLLATIHATERGRHHGLHNPQQSYINDVEWHLTYEAWRVIVCSEYMRSQVVEAFRVPADKIRVIPNGIDPLDLSVNEAAPLDRNRYAHPSEKIVFFVGRLVREKGAQVLLEAMPAILQAYHATKFVVAGSGPMEEELRRRAGELGVSDRVYFTGYVDDATRNWLYRHSAVAVAPSLYEPFGYVALEAMAAGTPVVASDTGGLGEIIQHGQDGLKALPGDAQSLAANVVRLLKDEKLAQRLKDNAYRKVKERFSYLGMGRRVMEVYLEVLRDQARVGWKPDPWSDLLERTASVSRNLSRRHRDGRPQELEMPRR